MKTPPALVLAPLCLALLFSVYTEDGKVGRTGRAWKDAQRTGRVKTSTECVVGSVSGAGCVREGSGGSVCGAVGGDPLLDLWPEVADEALRRPCRGVAERADGVPFYLAAQLLRTRPPQALVALAQPPVLVSSTCNGRTSSMSISSTRASPLTKRLRMLSIHPVPSRHGVHCPQL